MPTQFDWRVGVLAGQPLFVCQYAMAKKHWHIVHHRANGTCRRGTLPEFPIDKVPPEVLDAGVRAASLIGDGLYGVIFKETADGVFIIEINDNPNLEHGIEDLVAKSDPCELPDAVVHDPHSRLRSRRRSRSRVTLSPRRSHKT